MADYRLITDTSICQQRGHSGVPDWKLVLAKELPKSTKESYLRILTSSDVGVHTHWVHGEVSLLLDTH